MLQRATQTDDLQGAVAPERVEVRDGGAIGAHALAPALVEVAQPAHLVAALRVGGLAAEPSREIGEYRKVVKPSRLARSFCFLEFPPIEETYEFHDEGGKTRVVCIQAYPNVQGRDAMAKSGAAEGGRESFERLDALLGELKG